MFAALLPLAVLTACKPPASPRQDSAARGPVGGTPVWEDATASTGLDFTHDSGMSGQWYMCESNGPGVALFDFDNDGDLDLFIVQGTALDAARGLPLPPASIGGHRGHARLYRNDLVRVPGATAEVHWVDISIAARLAELPSDYGMGVAAGDFDNDGYTDLYLTSFGPNRLLRNDRGRRLTDVTAAVGGGLDEPRWSLSAGWFDFDRDGYLDLVCANYLDFTFANHRLCPSRSGAPDFCGPAAYKPLPSRLWRNQGDGTFRDVGTESGIALRAGAGFGTAAADFDGDGWPDLYVANDGMANHLWLNQGNGTFREAGLERGCALNGMGATEANMGVAAADFDEDGDDDLLVTHLDGEKNTLWRNLGRGHFTDVSAAAGIDGATRPFTGFGIVALDFDNDGWLDHACVNGAVKVDERQRQAGIAPPLRQHAQVFRGLGGGRFVELTDEPELRVTEIGRGLAVGDLDNDGDPDLVLANNSGPARVLLNRRGQDQAWLGFRLLTPTHRDALGAVAVAELSNGRRLHRRSHTDGSYASSSDPRVRFGLGAPAAAIRVVRLTVRWPDGTHEAWTNLPAGRYQTLVQGATAPRPIHP